MSAISLQRDRLMIAPWKRMLASEYSPICDPTSVLGEGVDELVQAGDFLVARRLRDKARRHAFQRRPDGDHLDDFGLGLADDEDAAPRGDADQPFLFELRQRLTERRAADAKLQGQGALVEPQLGVGIIDVHGRNGGLQSVDRCAT